MKLKPIKRAVKESDIEKYLVKRIASLGGVAYKFTSPSRRAVPDRLCVLPQGVTMFVECKKPKQVPTKAQQYEIGKLQLLGHAATYVSSKDEIDLLIANIVAILNTGETHNV